MKKRLLALLLSGVMAAGTLVVSGVPTLARPFDQNALPIDIGYDFRDTTDLQADYFEDNNVWILTWPSVAKDGSLLNQNPLRASDSIYSAPGDPAGSFTQPSQGLIVKYNGWFKEYSPSKLSISLTGNEEVMKGIVAGEGSADQQTILDYAYDSNTKAYLTGTKSHIDEEVVAVGYAKSYKLEYKESTSDTWLDAGSIGKIDHQKKLFMSPDTEGAYPKTDPNGLQYVEDNKGTVFLITQQVETFPTNIELEESKEYDIRISAYDGSGNKINIDEEAFSTTITAGKSNVIKKEAFPTVEGAGKYTSGGRTTLTSKGEVYVVTNLEDSVSNPPEGSLRYGLKNRKGANVPLTIVFAVGGTIHIDPTANKGDRKIEFGNNTTVAGQTAPGEGITIAGGSCKITGDNIIMRYMRFRTGEGYDIDGATIKGSNIVVDHCSFSWGIDETFTAKELLNSSVSYNIISSGLTMVNKNGDNNNDAELMAGESEFKHGMGSLLNGYNATITHNVWAHNGTRNPRFEGGFEYLGKNYDNLMTYANNVVYNWGHNSSYGGERGNGKVNFEGNYYKAGPNTLDKCKNRIMDFDSSSTGKSTYYISDNYINGSAAADGDTNAWYDKTQANFSTSRFEIENDYTAEPALTAYDKVMAGVGASLHRDAQDDRLIAQIKNGTGRFINSEKEAGGYITIENAKGPADSDSDGIPDFYEALLGTSSSDKEDSTVLIEDESSPYYGYTNLEVYINDITGEWGDNSLLKDKAVEGSAADRTFSSDDMAIVEIIDNKGSNVFNSTNTDLIAGEEYTVKLKSNLPNLGQGYVLLNDQKLEGSEDLVIKPTETGSYLMQAVYRSTEANAPFTMSDPINVTILKNKDNMPGFTPADIGNVKAKGTVSYDADDKSLIVEGAGLIGYTSSSSKQTDDAFFYDYKEVEGDFDISAKIENWEKIDYYQKAGLMVRESADPKSEFYMNTLTYIKGEEYSNNNAGTDVENKSVCAMNVGPVVRETDSANVVGTSYATINKYLSIPKKRASETPNPVYMKIARRGNTITMYASMEKKSVSGSAGGSTGGTAEEKGLVGDVDGNGSLTANDAAVLLASINGISRPEWNTSDKYYTDVNGDNAVDLSDVNGIISKVLDSSYKFADKSGGEGGSGDEETETEEIAWIKLGSYETTLSGKCLVGFAVDAAQDTTDIVKYNKAKFSEITIK